MPAAEKKVSKKTRRAKIEHAPFNVYTGQINEFVKVTLKFKETHPHVKRIAWVRTDGAAAYSGAKMAVDNYMN